MALAVAEQIRMKIAVAGFYCETNSFTDVVPEVSFMDGPSVRAAHTGAESALAGYIDYEEHHPDFRLQLFGLARVSPGGALSDAVLDTVLLPLLQGLAKGATCGGALLALHGSAMTKERHDVDADIVQAVREILGPRVTIGVTLDAHANVSPRMCALADIVTLYKTTPHVDQRERGFSTASMLADAMAGRTAPVVSVVKVPVVSGVLHQNSMVAPLKGILDAARSMEQHPGILSVDVALGNAFSDTPNLGMSVVAVADVAAGAGEAAARSVAGQIWANRASLTTPPDTIDQLVKKLVQQRNGRTLVIDLGDNIYGGASGRSAELFLALTRRTLPNVVAAVFAPEDALRAVEAGIGNRVVINLLDGESCAGNVAAILRDTSRMRPHAAVLTLRRGLLALSFDRSLAGDPRPLLASNLVPDGTHIIVVKGDHRSANALGHLFDRVVWTGTDGATTPWFRSLPYQRRSMPCWPFDST